MISTVIVTHNEAEKLERCLISVNKFSDEILVIDLESTDNVKEVCQKYQAKIVSHPKVSHVELIRNLAITKSKYEWVLVLDPDEKITFELGKFLVEFSKQNKFVALNIARKNIFFGRFISHTNFWPDPQIRFFKKKHIDWPTKIHTYPKIEGEIMNLDINSNLVIEHYGYDNLSEFFDRQDRYSSVEAKYLLDQGKHFSVINLVWQPFREFLVRFIKYQAYLDGFYGVMLTLGLMWYQILIQLKLLKLSFKK